MPRHNLNSTGRHTGCEQNGTVTTIPMMIHRLPRPSALGSCAEPSWSRTRRTPSAPTGETACRRPPPRSPRRRRATGTRSAGPASARFGRCPRRGGEEPAYRVERHRRGHPAPASMPTTVRRVVCVTSPVASRANNANVRDRRNAGRNASSRARHDSGRVGDRSIGATPSGVELSLNRRCFAMLTARSRRHADYATRITDATKSNCETQVIMVDTKSWSAQPAGHIHPVDAEPGGHRHRARLVLPRPIRTAIGSGRTTTGCPSDFIAETISTLGTVVDGFQT